MRDQQLSNADRILNDVSNDSTTPGGGPGTNNPGVGATDCCAQVAL
jgi:hypothetical protein